MYDHGRGGALPFLGRIFYSQQAGGRSPESAKRKGEALLMKEAAG